MITTFAVIGAFVVAFALGLAIGGSCRRAYISKKICRECRRTIVEYGFHSDGKEYKAQEVKGGAE